MFSLVLISSVYESGCTNKNSRFLELDSDSGCFLLVVEGQLISKCSDSNLHNPMQRIEPIFGSILCV